jgi:hypothetical protein
VALGVSGFMVLDRYGYLKLIREALANGIDRIRVERKETGKAKARVAPTADAARAIKAAADVAGWENTGDERMDGAEKNSPVRPEERQALEKRVTEFLGEVQKDPGRIARFLDPEIVREKAALAAQRTFTFILNARPPQAPPLKAGEITLENGGRFATVAILGFGRPITLRWIHRRGEWYLCPLRKRPGENPE